ncbi:MAG: amino acid permease [Gammaproteobacteria bacterium]
MPNYTSSSQNHSKLSLPVLTSLVIGNMIGTGIFLVPASVSSFGSISIFAWVLTSFGALLLALTFSSLNQKLPKTGGPYAYCKAAYGNFIGFVVAYTYWISVWVSTAGIAVSSIGYLGVIFKGAQTHHPWFFFFIEITAVWFFTVINILGIRTAGFLQLILTSLKIIPLILIIVMGLFKINIHNFAEFNISGDTNLTALTNAAALTVWAFIGLETATVPAEHTKSPKDVYRATVYGTLITAAIYILSTIVLMGLIPPESLKSSTSPFSDAASILFGENLGVIVAICAIVAGLGSLNVCTMIQGQIPLAAARDNLFPKIFSKLSRFDSPAISQVVSAILITVILVFTVNTTLMKQFNILALLATLATLTTYFICTMAELMLLIKESEEFQQRMLIKPVVIALLAGGYSYWMMIGAGKEIVFYGTLLLFSSFPMYALLLARQKQKSRICKNP